MKLVAFARYNCMQVMVVELQQQLAELEERERLGAVAEVAVGGSRVPPRNRANPFNSGGRERQGRIWGELHKQFGQEIIKDREEWGVNKDRGGGGHRAHGGGQPVFRKLVYICILLFQG
jgi:hypothetical protein